MKRVVITGAGAVTPFGLGTIPLMHALNTGQSGVRHHPDLQKITGLTSQVAGLVPDFDSRDIPRKLRRSMSRASQFAYIATREALEQAQISMPFTDSSIGLAAGSTTTSVETMEEFFSTYLPDKNIEQTTAMLFFRTMGHSVAANLSQAFGISGRVLSPAAACSTALQAIGLGYESIRYGAQRIMLCGGADEHHPLTTATFDIMAAASTAFNDSPQHTPRPFDTKRDGIVCAEGAGILVLEELSSALQRKAVILAEITGFATLSDPINMASPDSASICTCMEQTLQQAGLKTGDISYINAHATGTKQGDEAECQAVAALFGAHGPPISSLKGHLGHTMAASGAIELIACLGMMQQKRAISTLNLDNIDPKCQGISLIQKDIDQELPYILKNSFALGGINCSLVIREYHD